MAPSSGVSNEGRSSNRPPADNNRRPMKRKFGQPTLPNLYYKHADGILSVPGYTFDKAQPWHDTGSMTYLAEGSSLKDSSNVLAKIAVAKSNGSMCLEREAHILGRISASSDNPSLRPIDFLTIPKENGDVVVLLLFHPGPNLLGRYLPPSKINELLLADIHGISRPPPHNKDIYMLGMEEPDLEEMEAFDIMDLASFLEFAIQATHCLESSHKAGIIHREVRANAFHLSAHTGIVRFVHFGNRAISLENAGSPSTLVLKAFDDQKIKVKEALCYLAPEQTGSIETIAQDHRTDLYSLGILFWTLLVGRGQLPFEGGPLELLHSIVQKTPILVQDVRRDVPEVLGSIIDKLLAKHPDTRYQSAYGLKADLLECQRRLLASVSAESSSEVRSTDLIPTFEIATSDRYTEFTLPLALFGREKETEMIKNVIRNTQTSFSRHFAASKGQFTITSSSGSQGTGTATGDDPTDDLSSNSGNSSNNLNTATDLHRTASARTSNYEQSILSGSAASSFGDGLRRSALRPKAPTRTQTVVVMGPPGAGKSSVVLANQAKWRSYGLWGHAKFQSVDAAPFSAILNCLSSVLRQLMVFHTDVHRFVNALHEKLGPQIQNAPLLYQGAPELQDILGLLDLHIDPPRERLTTRELRTRFQTLVETVFTVIAGTRMLALFLDDLQDADDSTLDLVSALINSKSRMLIFATIRSDRTDVVDRVRSMFSTRAKPVWMSLEPMSYLALSSMVGKALRRDKEECSTLTRTIYDVSSGNAFSARNLLSTFHRQGFITFDWPSNSWKYDMAAIEATLASEKASDPTDLTFLVAQLKALPDDARKYLMWAGFFGESFKVTEVALMMHLDDSSSSSGSEDEREEKWKAGTDSSSPRGAIVGLQKALDEGWLIQRARDMCSFSHDRYRQAAQAAAASLPEEVIAKMSFRIVIMMLHESPVDVYRISEHAKRCLPLLHAHAKREELLNVLMDAGEEARNRGAHELAIRSFKSAKSLLRDDPWSEHPHRTFALFSRLASLANWEGDFDHSNAIIEECLMHAERPEDKGNLLRLRSRNHWMRGEFAAALDDTLLALKILGVDVDPSPSARKAERMFTEVENEILAVGHDDILSLTRATDPRHLLAVQLLNDAGTNAYWSPSPSFAEIIGLTTIKQALRHGLAPGTGLGFFWALGGAAENRKKYRFASDLSKLALRIADRYGTSSEKCRARVLYCALVSGFNNTHIRSQIPQLEEAVKFGRSAGDRVYTSFASTHVVVTRLFVCDHLSEVVVAAEEVVNDIEKSASGRDTIALAIGVLNCVRALGGYTDGSCLETVFDVEDFKESEYSQQVSSRSGNVELIMNWYNSFKLVAYYCLGYSEEAAKLGFYVYNTRKKHPNHRHVRYALFFHSLAMITCLRKKNVAEDVRVRYLNQININQAYIEEWLSPGPVNTNVWVVLVEAELKSLMNDSEAIKSYDKAIRLAIEHDWLMEEGWGHYLEGCHFSRIGVIGLGGELQRRGISRHSQWGAQGIVNYLNSDIGLKPLYSAKRPTFTADVAVQTSPPVEENRLLYHRDSNLHDTNDSTLRASDLDSILKWSTDISSNINLFSALQRLTEIATEISGSQNTCVVIVEDGDYTVATTMHPPEDCKVYEHHKAVRSLEDPLQQAVIRHSLNSKDRVVFRDDRMVQDPRFLTESQQSQARNVICLPIFSNRGQTFGVVYVSTRYSFPENTLTMLTLLCQQASISVSNALLFRSVQAGTKENLKMISAQRDALETARKSREDALKATKIKSNFLASMSHELRTPFSSFYGLLDLLTSTHLDSSQSEIVQTAKQSCELLLKIIDSILDYSKLEASALKLEMNGFAVENIIADCMELLLPLAAKKLDLSYNIEANVPPWVFADDARIRQVLMNLIGNAVKFTERGFVQVTCCIVNTGSMSSPDEVNLKIVIQDSGIGLAPSDVELLFVPFQQADNSSTRRFGGTGLGLSISRQLVKLMNGAIGVESELDVGSKFWFTIPVKIFQSDESKRLAAELEHLRTNMQNMNIVVCSTSTVTLSLLQTFFAGFNVTPLPTIQDVEAHLRAFNGMQPSLDFIILDDQSDDRANALAKFLKSMNVGSLDDTKVIHLYTPITHVSRPIFGTTMPGVVKMTKPPRQMRILQLLAKLKNIAPSAPSSSPSSPEKDLTPPTQRTLFGNVLIAEDNPIAQQLLVKILQRANLTVVATSNGNEAISEWESRESGYFTVALFDHHMPICDGVEAAKRIRLLESKRKSTYTLPIVALSADCQESTKQLCLSAGMNAFFSKPLKQVDLTALLSMFSPSTPS